MLTHVFVTVVGVQVFDGFTEQLRGEGIMQAVWQLLAHLKVRVGSGFVLFILFLVIGTSCF